MSARSLADSYQYCRDVVKKRSNFYLGIRLANKELRNSLFAVYSWFRYADDVADNTKKSIPERLSDLKLLATRTNRLWLNHYSPEEFSEPFWLAFIDTIQHYQLSKKSFDNMICCQCQDLEKNVYQNQEELYQYCQLAAGSSVAQIYINLCGLYDEESSKLAEMAGVALQLTNILRDPLEDIKLNRVYIPLDFLEVSLEQPKELLKVPLPNQIKAKERLIALTKAHYQQAFKLARLLKKGRFTFLILINSYFSIFNKICQDPNLLIDKSKTKLNTKEKILILGRSLLMQIKGI